MEEKLERIELQLERLVLQQAKILGHSEIRELDAAKTQRQIDHVAMTVERLNIQVSQATQGPLDKVSQLERQLAEKAANDTISAQRIVTLEDEVVKLRIDKAKLESRVRFLEQAKSGPPPPISALSDK
ncbi:uncharacterized protein SRS1_15187 [Sporisorium reilianum f. sp. reilianum]|uniref:Uncharacterized protein n=1 Tax=Sporisorium reilianum f. sp. reilianum TaxID=72559 RepID=A0A2N8UIA5_9BASI|nr:uncharacterized protein SRS1_15187 [Sporisorium reilianum f. sp. reilianum]